MKPAQYKALSKKAQEYFKSLDLETVRDEFTQGSLLNRNKKLEKGTGVPNFGLEMTPSMFAQKMFNMCGNEGQCLFTCLVFSGVSNMMKSKSMELSDTLKKRIRRTFLFLNDQVFFLAKLRTEIQALSDSYKNVAVRLNVFSDVEWDSIFPTNWDNVTMYDYTKRVSQFDSPTKHFTYSASEKDTDKDLQQLLKKGYNVAMVFHTNKLPATWNGFQVIDGDDHDRRYEDPKGVVVGLKQKTTMGGKHKTKFTRAV